jgi:pre-mRNA-processing factor 6
LTSLGTESAYRNELEVGDLRRARLMLQSAVQTNPGSSQAWISAARLEELAMDGRRARELIRKACDACPESEDVWLEALRLLPREQSVALMAAALAQIPASARLWLKAAEMEGDVGAKRRLLRRALERVPTAPSLWVALIELEEEEADAKALLGRAVECCPQSVDLWLALARLEDHLGARQTINRARAACPRSRAVWLAAARLEEAYGNTDLVGKIVGRAVGELGLAREDWLKSALELDAGGDTATAMAIVRAAYGRADEDPSVLAGECLEEAQAAEAKGAQAVAQAFVRIALGAAPHSAEVWGKAIDIETRAGAAHADGVFRRALEACPRSPSLWLKHAQHKQAKGLAQEALCILEEGLSVLPDSEALWLAALKLLQLHARDEPARALLERARAALPDSERLWRKSAELETSLGRHEEARRLLVQGVARFGRSGPKLWALLAQLEADAGNPAVARGVLQKGLEECPAAELLWRQAALLEASLGPEGLSKARSLLEKGRAAVDASSSDALWLASVQLEVRAGQPQMAKTLLAKALQTLPNSSSLWAEAVAMESRPLRKAKASAALNRLGHDAAIYLAIAKMMWADRKLDQAKEYFERALAQDMANGDVWAWYILFAREQQGMEEASRLEALAFRNGPPRNGILWKPFRKASKARFHAAPQDLFAAFMRTLPPI